jgi:hypothetical protein
LQDDVLKTGDVDKFEIGLFLNGAGDASGVHFGGFLDLGGRVPTRTMSDMLK